MDKKDYITISSERKRGQHLGAEERGIIQSLKKLGYSNRAIAREVNCSPSTVGYELARGTPTYSGRGRKPGYSAKRGAAVYKVNRSRCHRPVRVVRDSDFIKWTVEQVRTHKWSLDVCVGYARRKKLFPAEEIPCTKTMYNLIWRGELPLSVFELPEALSRRKRGKPRISKRLNGRSIEERPQEVTDRNHFGDWESDTVLGKKGQGEPAVFTIVERMTGCCLTLRAEEKTTDGIAEVMDELAEMFGDKFSEVFKTITTDNGSEFAAFSEFEALGTKVYFAHPYSAWERPVNERTNRIVRQYVPKGVSIKNYSSEQLLMFADEINSKPRKSLGYYPPEELFDKCLDEIYAR